MMKVIRTRTHWSWMSDCDTGYTMYVIIVITKIHGTSIMCTIGRKDLILLCVQPTNVATQRVHASETSNRRRTLRHAIRILKGG